MPQAKKSSVAVLIPIRKRRLTPGEVRSVKEVIWVLNETRKVRELAAADNPLIIGRRPRYPQTN